MASGRRYYEASDGRRYHRLQHLTVEDIFAGTGVQYPGSADAASARRAIQQQALEETLPLDFSKDSDFELRPEKKKAKMIKAALPLGFARSKPRRISGRGRKP
ncbi:MAG TPA: hypothetical protein VI485_21480 [Vicinamibacterales bacterium]|nr:hypothetical protein [Vicinamibacterales bacterium]